MRYRVSNMALPVICCVLLVWAGTGCRQEQPKEIVPKEPAAASGVAGSFSPHLPDDVRGGVVNAEQYDYDSLSWDQFIALNWPALPGRRGVPDTTKALGYGGPVVWETWKSPEEIFLPDGARPDPWDSPVLKSLRLPKLGALNTNSTMKLLVIPAKISVGLNQAGTFSSDRGFTYTGSLIDQNGMYTRYEVRINRAEFEYIYRNNYYNGIAQADSVRAGRFRFPPGVNPGDPSSIEIKAAWRVLITSNPAPGQKVDDTSRYFTRQAMLYDMETGQTVGPVTVGLVGLHILRLLPHAHNWVWSTFEHVDNLKTGSAGIRPSYNPDDTMRVNGKTGFWNRGPVVGPAAVKEPDLARAAGVWRYYPIGDPRTKDTSVPGINAYYRKKLESVAGPWKYYELIGTQNPLPLRLDKDTGRADPAVLHLFNSTMETYLQTTSSCFSCHKTAVPLGTDDAKKLGTFTFVLQKAQPHPRAKAPMKSVPAHKQ